MGAVVRVFQSQDNLEHRLYNRRMKALQKRPHGKRAAVGQRVGAGGFSSAPFVPLCTLKPEMKLQDS